MFRCACVPPGEDCCEVSIGLSKQMRDVLLENQLITQENKNSTAAGQAQA